MMVFRFRSNWTRAAAFAFAGALAAPLSLAQGLGGTVSFSTVGGNAYFAADTNSCAIAVNNLTTATVGANSYQFATFYNSSGGIMLGRRTPGSPTWTNVDTGISDGMNISDDHDVIAAAVDSTGVMHLSWGMHNIPLNYALSSSSVMGTTFNPSFTTQTSSSAPSLFPNSGSTTNEVTYPQFYPIPGSSNLLFTYRNGGAGGGSGNGNQYFDIYNPSTKTWTNNFVINGELTNVNAYLNNLVNTSTGNLLASWTWRATANWQTNSNIMFAQSPQSANVQTSTTWYKHGGTTQYGLPIIQSIPFGDHTDQPNQVAQTIWNIPQGDSFINQTSMTVDAANNPVIATYFAPGWTATSATSGSGNPNRQYMLVYYTGTQWKASQVSNRTSDTAVDSGGSDVRDLGRPIVLIDKQNRVLVVTRSEDTAMGSFSNPGTPNNDIVVYWNTVASLDSATPAAWQSITLDTANMGAWEPTYDSALWSSQNKLDLFYDPLALSGETSASVQVLEWNEQSFFAAVPEPASATILLMLTAAGLSRRCRR